jgi:hypothetical protein
MHEDEELLLLVLACMCITQNRVKPTANARLPEVMRMRIVHLICTHFEFFLSSGQIWILLLTKQRLHGLANAFPSLRAQHLLRSERDGGNKRH